MTDPFAPKAVVVPREGDPVARVQTVCTGNICRSPMATGLLQHEADRRLGSGAVAVDSSGIHALVGDPAVRQTRARCRDRGVDVGRHRARQSEPDEIRACDLVVTMTEHHRSTILRDAPSAAGSVFTIRELARILDALQPIETGLPPRAHLREVVRVAHAARLHVPQQDGPEDVADPYGRSDDHYDRMADELTTLVASIAPQLFGFLPGEA